MYSLPISIIRKIFELDPTYHLVYKELLQEYKKKMSFWKIKWLNKEMDWGSMNRTDNEEDIKEFRYIRKDLNSVLSYWNNNGYPDYYNIYLYQNSENCSDQFITDNNFGCKYVMNHLRNN
jgi:hypothetical protein